MAFPSSQPRSDSLVAREHATVLLEDGARIEEPDTALLAAAESMHAQGLIEYTIGEFVTCAEPRDRDFPPRDRRCQGRILLDPALDEDGDEIRCPLCDRPVRPYALNKHRHRALRTTVRQTGVLAWLRTALDQISTEVRDLGDNAFHVAGFGDLGVVVCIADADAVADSRFNTRDYAATNPVCYVTISPGAPDGRLLRDDWVCRVALADLLAGAADLGRILNELAASPRPSSIGKVDIPVYARGHVLIQPEVKPHPKRLFVVELCDDVVRVDGEIVVNPQAGPRLALFRILWRQFMKDIEGRGPIDGFTSLSLKRLLELMKAEGHSYTDEGSLRKLVNNLQSDLETAVKRGLGRAIGREDIVQACRMQNQSDASGGYRLNPLSVAIRPAQPR